MQRYVVYIRDQTDEASGETATRSTRCTIVTNRVSITRELGVLQKKFVIKKQIRNTEAKKQFPSVQQISKRPYNLISERMISLYNRYAKCSANVNLK